jgi:hypothetical protein
MSFNREQVGEIEVSLSIYRNGERLENAQGAYDLKEFLRGFEIYESLTQATLECMLVLEDSAGLIGALTGSELFVLNIVGTVQDRTYQFRSYEIASRSRSNQGSDMYIVNCASDEYIRNEITNVFGNSEIVFESTGFESSQIVDTLLSNQFYLGTQKNLFLEESLNSHQFVAPNWRVFDTIYWIAARSIRKSQSGGALQNGYVFYENALGFHFKSIDKIIEDANNQTENQDTDVTSGRAKLYTYVYAPKKSDEGTRDQFKINSIVFPNERNFLNGLRHGTWSGFSMGFDPNTITSSKMGTSTDMSVDAYRYSLSEMWNQMNHLGDGQFANPFEQADDQIQSYVDYPKRVRYTILPNQIFDQKNSDQPGKNYEALVELQAYQWMRFESLKTIKLQITIPGNLDLYVGSGIDVIIPSTSKSGSRMQEDRKYSGRYIIAALTHKSAGPTMTTELFLVKDSIRNS